MFDGSLHGAYRQMISHNYQPEESSWRLLKDTADTARYNIQMVSPSKANLALKCLKAIRTRFRIVSSVAAEAPATKTSDKGTKAA